MTPSEELVVALGLWPFSILWSTWLLYWLVSARTAKRNKEIESRASRVSHWLPACIGAVIVMATQPPDGVITPMLWPFGIVSYVASFALTALGLAFTVWARVHLGTNWSSTVARKHDQELIRSGPYAWVRHPIYSGLLLAIFGVFVGRGDVGALIGSALAWYGFFRRLGIEEQWLKQTFGDAYERYSAEVPRLLPWPGGSSIHN